jgi:radical SAM superfamily enzyme YgiQ (UPF0313 family)
MRVVLVNPPSPEPLGSPLLGLQYVASALLARGHEVVVVDAAARRFAHDDAWVVQRVRESRPDVVGVALFTRWVWHAYRLVERLRGEFPLLVAGGAHATVRPDEALARGFDVAVVGEAEHTFPEVVERFGAGRTLDGIPGVLWRAPDGSVRGSPAPQPIEDLDALPRPLDAQDLFDPSWYRDDRHLPVPGGVMTSRGCPARCTFCANYVTGRRFRHRSAASVVSELNALHAKSGATFVPFWDDALTADVPRLVDLCGAIERGVRFPLVWGAITRVTMVRPTLLRTMRRAGLVHVNFGVESGDDEILRAIRKGITTAHVVRALEWAKAEGLMTACNFMLGFPEDTPESLERTLRFMERIAPLVDTFSTVGVVVPLPGTPLYESNHGRYGFTDWWLREECARREAAPDISDVERFRHHYAGDATLDLDFFRYDDPTRALIRECLQFKANHNLVRMGIAPAASA